MLTRTIAFKVKEHYWYLHRKWNLSCKCQWSQCHIYSFRFQDKFWNKDLNEINIEELSSSYNSLEKYINSWDKITTNFERIVG